MKNRVRDLIAALQRLDQNAVVVNLDSIFDGNVTPGYFNPRSRLPWSGEARGGSREVGCVHLGFFSGIAEAKPNHKATKAGGK